MKECSVKIKSTHNEIIIFVLSKMFKTMNIPFKSEYSSTAMLCVCEYSKLVKANGTEYSLRIKNDKNNKLKSMKVIE